MLDDERPGALHRVRFGVFELDVRTGELRKAGARVRVNGQPLLILEQLVQRPGELVTREELQHELWSDDTFVDFERNLNSAIKRLRAALGDSADCPRLIETLPRRGYRFLVPVERLSQPSTEARPAVATAVVAGASPPAGPYVAAASAALSPEPSEAGAARGRDVRRARAWGALAATAALSLAVTVVGLLGISRNRHRSFETIAVLPFIVAGADSPTNSDEYLGFAIAEALITELSHLDGIRIISQTSSLQYKAGDRPLPQIAKELHADVVIEGSVIREGKLIRTTVQLIDAGTDTHLWADSYEREIGSVLTLAGEVSRAVAREVHLQLSPKNASRLASGSERSVSEKYLKGRYYLAKGTVADFSLARKCFEEALAIDPSDARSHSGLADYYILDDTLEPEAAFRSARLHALRALALDERLPDAHASLGFIRYYGDWDWAGAEQEFKRAIELNPGHARALRWYGLFLSTMGKHQDAEGQIRRAVAVDPVAITNYDVDAAIAFNARRYAESVALGRTMLGFDRFDARGHEHVTLGLLQLGEPEGALESAEKGLAVSSSSVLLCLRAMSLHRLGRGSEAEEVIASLEREANRRYVPPVFLAIVRADFGQSARALDLLERAYDTRDPYLVLLHVSPWFDSVRGSSRFRVLHARMNFPN